MTSQRILVTGSSQGLGLSTARGLAEMGHRVILHARDESRASAARAALPEAESVLVADAMSLTQLRALADEITAGGGVDAIVHNVGVSHVEPVRIETEDGHAHVLQVNVLAPYLLTALLRPSRLVWLSSGLHRTSRASLDDIDWVEREWDGPAAYADSKLFDAALSAAVARLWPDAASNAVEPGWVATRMGGPGATDDLALGHVTQVWLADATDPAAQGSGGFYYHQQPGQTHPAVDDIAFQDALLAECARLTGVSLPVTAAL